MRRPLAIPLAFLALFGGGTWLVLSRGAELAAPAAAGERPTHGAAVRPVIPPGTPAEKIADAFTNAAKAPLSLLLLQVLVIVAAARVLGALFRRIGQPAVVGEMVAGILLGPSLLGLAAPAAHAFLFPEGSLLPLRLLSQIGVILFLFVIGVELDVEHLRQRARTAIVVSQASILVPFFLGSALAIPLYGPLAPAGVAFPAFALFVGIAMSITAFPVLARILEERGLTGSHLGSTALSCAAFNDVAGWCLLAVVAALAQASSLAASARTFLLTVAFIAAMLFLVRPLATRILGRRPALPNGGATWMAGVLCFLLASSFLAELIGIHALFGAFLAGVCLPSSPGLRELLRERLGSFTSVLLLPLFFALTGLRTQIGLLSDARSWLICAGIVLVAIAGKLGGTMAAARTTGMAWGDSFSLGALMNTRGLVELIVLNLGYEMGVLSPAIFTMLVLMALITTFMTGPLLDLREAWGRRAAAGAGKPVDLRG
jgi:Kef-type K+ transport system membrane component KefB